MLRYLKVHFEFDQWENNRADGKRKLKCNAVPTIFSYYPLKIKTEVRRVSSVPVLLHSSPAKSVTLVSENDSENFMLLDFNTDINENSINIQALKEKLKHCEGSPAKSTTLVSEFRLNIASRNKTLKGKSLGSKSQMQQIKCYN